MSYGGSCRLANARAAQLAGYDGNVLTLGSVGAENLQKPAIKAEIDKRITASIPSAQETLALVSSTAVMDVTPYVREDGTLDVQRMGEDGLGHLVIGVKPGREGPEITLANPQTSRKMLARYHKLLGSDVQVDVNATLDAGPETLAALAAQIGIVQASIGTEQDDTDDSIP